MKRGLTFNVVDGEGTNDVCIVIGRDDHVSMLVEVDHCLTLSKRCQLYAIHLKANESLQDLEKDISYFGNTIHSTAAN